MNTATLQKKRELTVLKRVCWAFIAFAGLVSIWANVLHAGSYDFARWFFAALPPIFVLAAWEIVSRIPIPADATWWRRIVRPLVTVLLAGGAAYLSYFHQRDAVMRYTGDISTAYVLPALVDGLMIIASVSTYELNLQLRNLDAVETARAAGRTVKADSKPKTPKQELPTGREKVARLFSQYPEMSAKEIARLAGVKEPYAYNVLGQLRKASELQTA
jgi:hypothetical protein